jgi:hypothetical protein
MDIIKEVALLRKMTVPELRARYAIVFQEPTTSGHREFMVRKIAWRLQMQEEGGLTDRAKKRAMELANDLDIRTRAPSKLAPVSATAVTKRAKGPKGLDARLPMPGTVITKDYEGKTLRVTVLRDGFDYDGKIFRSLSAIARAVTGTNWNGFHFFGLNKNGRGA